MIASAFPATPLLDLAQLDDLIESVGFDAFVGFAEDFIEELRVQPRVIAGHFAQGDAPATRSSAHYLKGPALSVGAARVAALSAAIERADPADSAALIAQLPVVSQETEQALRMMISM